LIGLKVFVLLCKTAPNQRRTVKVYNETYAMYTTTCT